MSSHSVRPSSVVSSSSSLPPVNFTGTWVLDPSLSDSLAPLMAYHGLRDENLLSLAESLIPTLVIDHSNNRISTKIYTRRKTAKEQKQTETSIEDDGTDNSASERAFDLSACEYAGSESYDISGKWQVVQLERGSVQSRCYAAPHGQSLIVDTRCRDKHDLERSERFCLEGGQVMVLEIRILTCDPARSVHETVFQQGNAGRPIPGVATPFNALFNKPVVAGNQVIVNELLFCKRVFRRVRTAAAPETAREGEKIAEAMLQSLQQQDELEEQTERKRAKSDQAAATPVHRQLKSVLRSLLYPQPQPHGATPMVARASKDMRLIDICLLTLLVALLAWKSAI